MGDFYGTGIEIWAGFGPVGKKIGPSISNFRGWFFHVFMDKRKIETFLGIW